MHIWGPPEQDEAWYDRMRADPVVKSVVETFIREVLPSARDDFRASFVAEAERVAPGLTSAFLDAAATAVHFGVSNSHDAIAQGALDDLAAFEAIIDAAIAVRSTPSDAERQRNAEIHLAIVNREYSDDYAEHLGDNDDGWTAGEFLEAYVQRVRATVGWRHLVEHRHRDRLIYYWFRELAKSEAPDANEIAGAFEVGRGSGDEDDLWHVLAKFWEPRVRRSDGGSRPQGPSRAARPCRRTDLPCRARVRTTRRHLPGARRKWARRSPGGDR